LSYLFSCGETQSGIDLEGDGEAYFDKPILTLPGETDKNQK
jgi:hypothetical protein